MSLPVWPVRDLPIWRMYAPDVFATLEAEGTHMESALVTISNELAKLVQDFTSSVVAVHAQHRFPSSGVQWREGVVVTASHTIHRDEDIEVTSPNGKRVGATLAGRDPGTDLAVLRVASLGAPAVELRPSESARVGELALVLARSPDSGVNASLGAVSAVSGAWQTWRGGHLDQYIRLDAKFFPNSSGGLVLDVRGRILGVATSGLSRIAGLAVPVSTVSRVVEKLLEKGFIPRGYLGIGVQSVPIPEGLRKKLSLPNQGGAVVLTIEPGGPADKAGILMGDVVVRLNETAVEALEDLRAFCNSGVIGQPVKAQFIRAGQLAEATIVVGERAHGSS